MEIPVTFSSNKNIVSHQLPLVKELIAKSITLRIGELNNLVFSVTWESQNGELIKYHKIPLQLTKSLFSDPNKGETKLNPDPPIKIDGITCKGLKITCISSSPFNFDLILEGL